MGDVVARRRIDAIERLEEQPLPAKLRGDGVEVCMARARETVAQMSVPVASVGKIEAGLALENRVATRDALAREADGQHCVAHGSTFAHRARSEERRVGKGR